VDARFFTGWTQEVKALKDEQSRTPTIPVGSSLSELQGTRPNLTDLRKNRPVEQQSKVVSVEVVVAVAAAAAVNIQQPNFMLHQIITDLSVIAGTPFTGITVVCQNTTHRIGQNACMALL